MNMSQVVKNKKTNKSEGLEKNGSKKSKSTAITVCLWFFWLLRKVVGIIIHLIFQLISDDRSKEEMTKVLLRQVERELNNRSDEYLEKADYMTKELVKKPVMLSLPNLNITGVSVIHNNYLKLLYELKKEEYKVRYGTVTERILYHATSQSKVGSIIKDNLDWRRVVRSKYGKGVSFSNDPDYANFYCNNKNGIYRAFIVTNVLIGRKCHGNPDMEVPRTTYDTATGANCVFVKFYDYEFLPLYVIYYKAPDISTSKFYEQSKYCRLTKAYL